MSVKTFKKGEALYKEGDKITSVYLIQSGSVSQCLIKGKKTVELFQLGSSQLLGDQILTGQATHTSSAIATAETKALEIPIETLKQTFDGSPQMVRLMIKSLADRMRQAFTEIRSNRLEKDSSPCPEDQVAKVFGTLFHTANHKGNKTVLPGRVVIEWMLFKQYAQRVFAESPKRLEQAVNILVKLKLAFFEMGKDPTNPDGPEEIQKVHFLDLSLIESFFEFYQYYYFKGGKTELLKVDELCFNLLSGIVKLAEGKEADRFGITGLEFTVFTDYCKEELGLNLNNDHFTRLETKGVLMKRKTSPDGVILQFEFKEFLSILQSWKMLREIEKWNEKGFVDIHEKEVKAKKAPTGVSCPECAASLQAGAKFCHECGHKITLAA